MHGTMPERSFKQSDTDLEEISRIHSILSTRPSSLLSSRRYAYLSDEGEDSAEHDRLFINNLDSYARRRSKYSRRKSSRRASSTTKMTKPVVPDEETDDDDSTLDQSDEELEEGVTPCSFGRISKRRITKHLILKTHVAPRRECRCSATVGDNDDLVCGWESKYQTGKYYRPIKAKRKTPNHNIPHAYQRLLHERDTGFDFHHYEEPSHYMEQYRYSHTVGGVCKVSYYHNDDMSDPYAPRVKANVW